MFTLYATKTALVVIDLQEGILPFAGGPHTADDVVSRAALAEKCRASARLLLWCASAGPLISPKR